MSSSSESTNLKPEARSRVTNGKLFLSHVDHRSIAARRLRDLIAIYSQPFGGFVDADEPTRQLVRKAAMLTLQSELLETKSAAGEEVNPITYTTLANSLSRVLAKLEAKRPKTTVPAPSRNPFQQGRTLADLVRDQP